MPDNLDIQGTIKPGIRYRGIYKSVVYESALKINGNITIPNADDLKNYEILLNEAYFTVGISDNRGLKGQVVLKTDSKELEAEPGVIDNDIFQSGIFI